MTLGTVGIAVNGLQTEDLPELAAALEKTTRKNERLRWIVLLAQTIPLDRISHAGSDRQYLNLLSMKTTDQYLTFILRMAPLNLVVFLYFHL